MVRDHCHYTGEYRGAAHSICNLKYSAPKKVPIVFHNQSSYNHHFFIKELAEEFLKNLLVQEKIIKNTYFLPFQGKKQ